MTTKAQPLMHDRIIVVDSTASTRTNSVAVTLKLHLIPFPSHVHQFVGCIRIVSVPLKVGTSAEGKGSYPT